MLLISSCCGKKEKGGRKQTAEHKDHTSPLIARDSGSPPLPRTRRPQARHCQNVPAWPTALVAAAEGSGTRFFMVPRPAGGRTAHTGAASYRRALRRGLRRAHTCAGASCRRGAAEGRDGRHWRGRFRRQSAGRTGSFPRGWNLVGSLVTSREGGAARVSFCHVRIPAAALRRHNAAPSPGGGDLRGAAAWAQPFPSPPRSLLPSQPDWVLAILRGFPPPPVDASLLTPAPPAPSPRSPCCGDTALPLRAAAALPCPPLLPAAPQPPSAVFDARVLSPSVPRWHHGRPGGQPHAKLRRL